MLTRDFHYDLPASAIADHPAPRGESRLLVLDADPTDSNAPEARHRHVRDLPDLLRPGDLLVVNDTRVIPARLYGRCRDGGQGKVEILLVEQTGAVEWEALTKPGRRTRPGTVIELEEGLSVLVREKLGDGRHLLRFSEPIEGHLDRLGHIPLPPYIRRADEAADRERYQTVYARAPGAIAAPTAGLHFSPELLAAIRARGVEIAALTLHVGIGTFKPVTAELVHEHRMESERYEISPETAAAIASARAEKRRIVAVGTTVVRALESAALVGGGEVRPGSGATKLFITPGFQFQVVDVLLTNFHLPGSTLLMLVSAISGEGGRERVLAAYREAVAAGYRFYSYGDAMLVERREG